MVRNNLFKLLAGVSVFSSLFVVNVQAFGVDEENDSASASVTVGSVQTPVYSADITWGDFSYDWVYDNAAGEFGWKQKEVESCLLASDSRIDKSIYNSALIRGQIYTDDSCSVHSNWIEYEDIANNLVFVKTNVPVSSDIAIIDSSVAGQLEPSISWVSNDDYDWVTGNFTYTECNSRCMPIDSEIMFEVSDLVFTDNECSSYIDKSTISYRADTYYSRQSGCAVESIDGGVIPEGAIVGLAENYRHYKLNFEIGIDSTKEIRTPKENDVIGTITVSIAARK